MKLDKETIIILATCMVLMLAWPSISNFMGWTAAPEKNAPAETQKAAPTVSNEKKSGKAPETEKADVKTPVAKAPVVKDVVKPAVKEQLPVKTVSEPVSIKNKDFAVVVSGNTGSIESVTFDSYHKDLKKETPISIAAVGGRYRAETSILNYFRYVDGDAAGSPVFDTVSVTVRKINDEQAKITRLLKNPAGAQFQVIQTVTLKGDYVIKSEFNFSNPGTEPVKIPAAVISAGAMDAWYQLSGDKIRSKSYTMDYMTADESFERVDADDDAEDFFINANVRWAGVANKYFSLLLKSNSTTEYKLWEHRIFIGGKKDHPLISTGAKIPEMELGAGESKNIEFELYAGPKKVAYLEKFAPGADDSLHLAWGPLNYFARFMMWVLNLLYSLCGSYGVSIILLTLLVRTAFYPITARGNESMKKMQKVQPKFKELREKYKDNPQLLNQKMAELYRQEGVNPFAGCLPILLQIPIFFALYAMLDNVIALRHVSFLWCENLAAADTVCRIPFPFFDNGLPLNPLVLAMTALMIVQQRMTPMSVDPMQKKMMMFMPLIMLLFLYDLPSGLTLYWTVSNVFSIVQLWLQKKRGQTPAAAAPGK